MEQEFRSRPLALAKIFLGCLALVVGISALFFSGEGLSAKDMFRYMFSSYGYFLAFLVIALLAAIFAFWGCNIHVRVTSTDVVFTRWGREYLHLPLDD